MTREDAVENELEAGKREATVIRRVIELSLRDDPDWK